MCTDNVAVLRARQNKLAAPKSSWIEFEVFGIWAWDVDCGGHPDTHWIEYEEMCEQLGVDKAKAAADIYMVDLHDAVTERTHEIEDEMGDGTTTPGAPEGTGTA